MIDNLLKTFLLTGGAKEAFETLKKCGELKIPNIGAFLGEYFSQVFPESAGVLAEASSRCFEAKKFERCFDLLTNILDCKNIPEQTVAQIKNNQSFCIPFISNRYIYYNKELVEQIVNRKPKPFPLITFTITTCKRYDLFEQTINSFLNCCKDLHLIDSWLCVDDNSSVEDREKMKKNYPFFTFRFKTQAEKGHPQSMNIIRQTVSTPYIFHIEDDFKFFVRKNFLSECMDVLSQSPQIGQCLINRNYAETERDFNIVGGLPNKTESGLRFYIHEHCTTPEQYKAFDEKYGKFPNSAYWAHFSFRPSLVRTVVLKVLGEFNERVSHFEREYSIKYTTAGFVSAFLENINCLHIGRLTSERWDETKANAYSLNEEKQFGGKEEQLELNSIPPVELNIKTFVVNLDRRPDRWKTFQEKKEGKCLRYERFSAIDGAKLTPNGQLQRIFEGNDYNMRQGMVGCAMSHIKLCIDLLKSKYDAYCILEDDLEFVPHFREKFLHLYKNLPADWDLCYLGHHLMKKYKAPEYGFLDKEAMPVLEKWDTAKSFEYSLGGTGGYLISKKGARYLLEILNKIGMTNGIDTMQQKCANLMSVYYCKPHLIYSDCWTPMDQGTDTDIQKDYVSLSLEEHRIASECSKYEERLKKNGEFNIDDALQSKKIPIVISYGDMTHVAEAIRTNDYPFDTVDEGNIEKFVKITERIAKMTDKELEQFISHDFCNSVLNEVFVQEYNKKVVIRNRDYGISFPHENVSNLTEIYIARFKKLKAVLQNTEPVLLIHASRWQTYDKSIFERLLAVFNSGKRVVKILTINGLDKNDSNTNIKKEYVHFPEHLRVEEWTQEKIGFDQGKFRVDIIPIIQNFITEK